jgi:uncharacterized membrane protein
VFRLPFRYSLIVTALGLVMAAVFLLIFLDLFNHLMRGDVFSVVTSLVGDLVLMFIVMVVVALIISAITWGYWLGDLGDGKGRRGEDRTEEARVALEVLEKKYANREITMSEYLALRKGIDRDRPKY